jgi:large subunit ribosomal protein L25
MNDTTSRHGALTVDVRAELGKGPARRVRQSGLIPGVMYGAAGEAVPLAVDPKALRKAIDPAFGYNTLFELTIRADGKPDVEEICMVADRQFDTRRDELIHIDFLRVDPDAEIERLVPVEFVGRAAGVLEGGILQRHVRAVRVAAKPRDLPRALIVDVTPIGTNESLRVADVVLDSGRMLEEPGLALAHVAPPKAEEEEAAPAEEEAAEAASEEEGKKEGGEAPAPEDKPSEST